MLLTFCDDLACVLPIRMFPIRYLGMVGRMPPISNPHLSRNGRDGIFLLLASFRVRHGRACPLISVVILSNWMTDVCDTIRTDGPGLYNCFSLGLY